MYKVLVSSKCKSVAFKMAFQDGDLLLTWARISLTHWLNVVPIAQLDSPPCFIFSIIKGIQGVQNKALEDVKGFR